MKADEEMGHDRGLEFETDDEENEAETIDDGEYSDDDSCSLSKHSDVGAYGTSWPKSYRQSIDMLTSVTPDISSLQSSSLSKLSSSFLSSFHMRPTTPEFDVSLSKPLISTSIYSDKPPSSLISLPHHASQSTEKIPCEDLVASRQCSRAQAIVNGVNILCGVGLLATPYAVKEGGWLGLLVFCGFGIISCYTGFLLKHCIDSTPTLQTYPDIGQAAFGTVGRLIISIALYMELYSSCVEFIILMSDNLSSMFPNVYMNIAGLHLGSQHFFAVMTAVAVMPTVWLRNLGVLSYLSAGGVISTILVVLCLLWVGVADGVGFHPSGATVDIANLPVAIGIYAFCFAGHAVFPNIYSSMKKPSDYTSVLLISFTICSLLYGGVAVSGFLMFGESTKSQFTLNMPHELLASKIAVWTTVINPLTKYALTITPIALSLEELLPSAHLRSHGISMLIRTVLVLSTLVVALALPFFGFLMALIGSFLSMIVALIFPCAAYLSIMRGRINRFEVAVNIFIIMMAIACAFFGSYSAIKRIADNMG